ncbi:2-C-methyl-D-erythritol 2,4-cyclodiphosphate synthase [Verrucomicrobium sp. GAS474]|uniref:2-C-methyl-D-erythritol 2,4-cyclodiphosphate synthase n=1 Tax=Verrucomicrobium sp. GAS474 TaxID=1882831 RepID=UPI000879A549|nr:2-C-methyl-D-erythritol 2,4-cyclodiphosphate synthase [Verrucomicrobium sp. GAS474]SDU17342.1 2-C-methyl-D-erythritol 2,4-cyclodiphosphate synthase [Verrucomicrobium sp. GAS474]
MSRVGIGYDVHPLVPGRKLFLGGVEIPYDRGLDGHSDADVLIHAIADAILGAIGSLDIGHHFPNSDERWRGVRSTVFLTEIARIAKEKGFVIENIDSSLISEAPKIGPFLAQMREAMGTALGIEAERIGIKATTNERLGFVGRGEGIAAMAVASLTKVS